MKTKPLKTITTNLNNCIITKKNRITFKQTFAKVYFASIILKKKQNCQSKIPKSVFKSSNLSKNRKKILCAVACV